MDRRKLSVGKVFRFTFTGWKAWAVLAVIIALAFTRYQMIHGGLPEALVQIKPFLKGSYIRQAIAERGTERARNPFPKFEVTFAEAAVRGVFSPRPVVRVKPLVNGGPPPDGREYRYYVMEFSVFTGYYAPIETGAWSWRLGFF